ncbi:MAG: SIMPL domain-containing protein [Pseudomonadota bacterium]
MMQNRFFAAAAAGAFALFAVAACAEEPAHGPRLLTVSGAGEVKATPDMATVSAGVVSDAKTATEALSANSRDMKNVMDKIKAAGVADKDIQTSQFSLYPRYAVTDRGRTDPERIVGYTAHNSVSIRVRDLEKLGGILDAVTKSGANSMGGLSFMLSDPDPLVAEARKDAVADAKAKAKLYAEAAGVKLGDLITLNENGAYAPRPVAYAARGLAESADVPIAPGEQDVTANVTLVFEIE